MFKGEVMEGEKMKKEYVEPRMTVIECRGPNLLNGSDTNLNLGDDEIKECDACEFN